MNPTTKRENTMTTDEVITKLHEAINALGDIIDADLGEEADAAICRLYDQLCETVLEWEA
jgi:flagellin-specific chaperone FliS